MGCRGVQRIIRGSRVYNRLHEVTRGYRGLQGITMGYRGLIIFGGYRGLFSLPGKLLFVFIGNWGNCALI